MSLGQHLRHWDVRVVASYKTPRYRKIFPDKPLGLRSFFTTEPVASKATMVPSCTSAFEFDSSSDRRTRLIQCLQCFHCEANCILMIGVTVLGFYEALLVDFVRVWLCAALSNLVDGLTLDHQSPLALLPLMISTHGAAVCLHKVLLLVPADFQTWLS